MSKKREVHASVFAMLYEVGLSREIIVLTMLEDEEPVGLQQVLLEDEAWNLRQFLQGVGRVGEDDVELLPATLQEPEHIATDKHVLVDVEFLHALLDEVRMVAVGFHAHHGGTATREQFQRDAARAGKQVQCRGTIEIHISVHHVEDVLLRHVGGRTGLERFWDVEMPSLVFPSNDSHFFKFQTLKFSPLNCLPSLTQDDF
jgi:hypothetical protein